MSDGNERTESMDFDSAIKLTGYGKFHYEMLVACALCIITVGFQNGSSGYIFPAAQCELGLNSFQLGLLNVSFLIGGTISSFFWGILADSKGRRRILAISHILNASVTITCALNNSHFSLVLCRFLNGFLIGAPGSIIFSYLGEFQPPKYRSSVICYSGLFFTSSWLLLPLISWVILPLEISYSFGQFFIFSSWRLFLIVLALPEVLVGFWFLKLPESPKFLVSQGKTHEALIVLKRMFRINTGKNPKDYPVKNVLADTSFNFKKNDSLQCRGRTSKIIHEVSEQIKKLFKPPLLVITVLTCIIMFTNMFGVFGLGLWLPELFIRFEKFRKAYPDDPVTIQQLALLQDVRNDTCKPSFDSAVIRSTVTMGVTSLLGNLLSGWLAGKVQVKRILCVTMLLGGLSAGSIYWLKSALQNLIVASIFQSTMVTANMTIGSVVVELFPTSVGAISICLIMCAGRLGAMTSNMFFGLFMDKYCEIPIFVVAMSVLIGSGLCFMIPSRGVQEKNADSGKQMELSTVSDFSTRL